MSPFAAVIYNQQLYLRVAAAGCNLCNQIIHNRDGAALALASDHSDQSVFQQIHAHRNITKHAAAFANLVRLFQQRIRKHPELFLRYDDLCLKRNGSDSEALIKEVLLGGIPVPQRRLIRGKPAALSRTQISFAQSPGVFFILFTDSDTASVQIRIIGAQSCILIPAEFFSDLFRAVYSPEGSDQGGGKRGYKTGIHKDPHPGTAVPGRQHHHAASQGHR